MKTRTFVTNAILFVTLWQLSYLCFLNCHFV